MPRQARLILGDVCYHIITRGNKKQTIFMDKQDRYTYLYILAKYKKQYKFKLYGWCLMDNHVHMIIESDKLAKLMHGINLSYAKHFNDKYKTVGHFWQDRYKSFVLIKDRYLINCIQYIEYNPVRGNLVTSPGDYAWSSYKTRVLGEKNKLLNTIML